LIKFTFGPKGIFSLSGWSKETADSENSGYSFNSSIFFESGLLKISGNLGF